jgi:hypothetical protein
LNALLHTHVQVEIRRGLATRKNTSKMWVDKASANFIQLNLDIISISIHSKSSNAQLAINAKVDTKSQRNVSLDSSAMKLGYHHAMLLKGTISTKTMKRLFVQKDLCVQVVLSSLTFAQTVSILTDLEWRCAYLVLPENHALGMVIDTLWDFAQIGNFRFNICQSVLHAKPTLSLMTTGVGAFLT